MQALGVYLAVLELAQVVLQGLELPHYPSEHGPVVEGAVELEQVAQLLA